MVVAHHVPPDIVVYVDHDAKTATWTCPLAKIDMDGCPDCYVIGGGGRDALANAYKIPRKWDHHPDAERTLNPLYHEWNEPGFRGWGGGVLKDPKGLPYVQGGGALEPGARLVSPTALGGGYPSTDQRRYPDATVTRYISVPRVLLAFGVELGDLVVVADGDHAEDAIVGDVGPGLTEDSIALADAFEIPSGKSGGDSHRTLSWTVFLGSRATPAWPRDPTEMRATAWHLAGFDDLIPTS